jgi:hypothetical protein
MLVFILERADKPGCYFPANANVHCVDYVGQLNQAQVFQCELRSGMLHVEPALPEQGCWNLRPVKTELI